MVTIGFAKRFEELSVAYSTTGKNNLERDAECEDVIFFDETPEIKFWGLADGQTGKKYCREGGKKVLEAVFQFILDKGIAQMTQYEHVDELQYELIRVIRDTISKLASNNGREKAEYASTLVIFAYDAITMDYISIHLGDGCVIGNKTNGEICLISPPENGLTTDYTWLTTSKGALYHLRIIFGKINTYKRLLLITDGATMIARGRNLSERAKGIINNGQQEEIVSLMSESSPADDASCIVIDFP